MVQKQISMPLEIYLRLQKEENVSSLIVGLIEQHYKNLELRAKKINSEDIMRLELELEEKQRILEEQKKQEELLKNEEIRRKIQYEKDVKETEEINKMFDKKR